MDETQKYEKKTDYVETIALIDGECIEYDMCNTSQDIPKRLNSEIFDYIGSGTIYSICGVRQAGIKTFHFWKYTEEYEFLRYS